MQKTYYHNNKKLAENSNVSLKRVVDVNILLNRVKIEEKNDIKRKTIFFSLITIMLILFTTFIAIIK
jgi:hypothetical protein